MNYLNDFPGLAEAVSASAPHAKHLRLMDAIRRVPGLENAKLTAVRDEGGSLRRRKVLDANGKVIHDDHEAWLLDEAARAGVGDAWRHLRRQNYSLSKCSTIDLFVTVDRGGVREDNFLQLDIELLDERLDRRLFEEDNNWETPSSSRELVDLAEQGWRRSDDQRTPLGPQTYRLRRTVDVASFVREAEQVYDAACARDGARVFRMTNDAGDTAIGTLSELLPECKPGPWKGRRLFEDWAYSSAGRSGARLCDHWALLLGDFTDRRTQEREMSLIPVWGFAGKLAQVKSASSDYGLYDKLQTMDSRLKVPFGWYFYMLHGNRVRAWTGERILRAAEEGLIVLPEHDYRVLKAWDSRPYGF